ncbi:MAG: ferritin family protein [Bacteroidales bacterium]|jgi:rubrerythrin|nr:ferritin family protein [Bacteroidales bacterium]
MKKFDSRNDILDFAINAEQEAINFYAELFKKTNNEDMKDAYKEFILEEKSHKDKLMKLKIENKLAVIDEQKITNLKISDYLTEKVPHENMDYGESLLIAMNKEKAAYKLYSDLASITENEELKKIFLFLATEEAKHKLKFETEYDEIVLKNN